jgi:hypothetical protein
LVLDFPFQTVTTMVPESVTCEDCGEIARVRAYGRIEYDWPKTTTDGQLATMPMIHTIRLTIDCPHCGVKQQEFHLDDSPRSARGRPSAPVTIRFRHAK